MMPLEAERESLVEDSFKKQRSGFAALQDMPAKLYGALFLVVLIIFGTTLILSSGGSAESVSNGNAGAFVGAECCTAAACQKIPNIPRTEIPNIPNHTKE